MKKFLLNLLVSLLAGFAGAGLFYVQQNSSGPLLPAGRLVAGEADSLVQPVGLPAVSPARATPGGAFSETGFVEASRASTQCVVYIKTMTSEAYERYSWFDLFFNYPSPDRKVVGSGSGVIFTSDGYIVTNNHVIDGAERIEVIYNKKTWGAELVGTDPSTDIALLKIQAENLPTIALARSRDVQVGDWVIAVGNPFNLASTVTAGIVSAKGRRINILEDIFPIESFIQTDAAINPGNSGGALVNLKGELVGINTAILSKTGSYAGYGFAVPADIVAKVVHDLKNYGEVQKAFLGVEVADLTEDLSNRLGTSSLNGVAITYMDKGAAAEQAGFKTGDVIVAIDGAEVQSKADFDELMSYRSPGDRVKIMLKRGRKEMVKEVVLLNIEGTTDIVKRVTYTAENLGAELEAVPKLDRARLGIENGVRIRKVDKGLISRMDLEEGFIVVAINNYRIAQPQELEEILMKIRGRVIVEGINREGKRKYYSYRF